MTGTHHPSPMNARELIDEYFIENRTRLLEIAAFMDRLDRTDPARGGDFRIAAFSEALRILAGSSTGRLMQIQMLLSDPTTEPRTGLDRKSARGAYEPSVTEARS
jgi:hypothetical protein